MLRSIFLTSILLPATLSTAAQKPNILVILTDDQGSRDVACYGAKDLTTPNMDTLAKKGVKFNTFYSAAPVCCPSRAGLMTAKNPWKVGVPSNIGIASEGMPSQHKTMPEYFKEAGYATGHVGKWHLGHHKETLPNGQGFDYSFGHHGGCIDNYSHFFYWNGPNKHDLYENGTEVYHNGSFFPDLMRDKALNYIDTIGDKPFMMYYAINLPHYPYQSEKKWLDHYADMKSPRKLYAAALSDIDENIGELLAGLKKLKKLDNTIIVFMSDHGHSTEVRAFGGGGCAGVFRGSKFSLYEGGIRVPAIVSYPPIIPQDSTREQMAFACDWLPTLLDFAGVNYEPTDFNGKSLRQVIMKDAASPHKHVVWKNGIQRAVRKGKWKLLENPLDTTKGKVTKRGKELYDLSADPGEKKNLLKLNPEIVNELSKLLPR